MITALLILAFSLIFINLFILYKLSSTTNKSLDVYYAIIQKNLDLILSNQTRNSASMISVIGDNKRKLEEVYKSLNAEVLKVMDQVMAQKKAPTEQPAMPSPKPVKRARRREPGVARPAKADPKTSDMPS